MAQTQLRKLSLNQAGTKSKSLDASWRLNLNEKDRTANVSNIKFFTGTIFCDSASQRLRNPKSSSNLIRRFSVLLKEESPQTTASGCLSSKGC